MQKNLRISIAAIISSFLLLSNLLQANATEYDAATKLAIENLQKQIIDKREEIKNRNFPKGICEPDYPPVIAAITEKNRLNKYYPYQLIDAKGNIYTPEQLSAKLGVPWIEVTEAQMKAAEAAIVAARQPCQEFLSLSGQIADIQSQLIELIQRADASDPRLNRCNERMPKLQFEVDTQKMFLKERSQFWNSESTILNFIDYYATNVHMSKKQSLDILYRKSFDELNYKQAILESYFKPNFETSDTSIKGCDSVNLISSIASRWITESEELVKQIESLKIVINQKYKLYSNQFLPLSITSGAATKKPLVRTITCYKGKLLKKISGSNPKCPSGYLLKK